MQNSTYTLAAAKAGCVSYPNPQLKHGIAGLRIKGFCS